MKAIVSIALIFSFLACTSTRKKESNNYDYRGVMLDTMLHLDVDTSFAKLPLSKDSIFSDSTIQKYASVDTINLDLKKQLFKLCIVNLLSDKIDTFIYYKEFFNSCRIYKLSRINLLDSIRSYLLYMDRGYPLDRILLLNVNSKNELLSVIILGARINLNSRIKSRLNNHNKLKMTINYSWPSDVISDYILFSRHYYSKETENIDFELQSSGKWKMIKYESKKKSGYDYTFIWEK